MKLAKSLAWKAGLVAVGVLSIVSLNSADAQTTTTTPTTGGSVTASANGTTGGNSQTGDNDGGYGSGMNGGKWNGGRGGQGGMMGGQGGMFGGRHGNMRGNGRGGHFGANAMIGGVSAQSIATYLGLTTEQLKADLDAGQSLAQIAVAQGKTSDDLRTFMIQQSTTAIDAALNQTTTSKANGGSGNGTTGGNGTAGNTTPSASATPAV